MKHNIFIAVFNHKNYCYILHIISMHLLQMVWS